MHCCDASRVPCSLLGVLRSIWRLLWDGGAQPDEWAAPQPLRGKQAATATVFVRCCATGDGFWMYRLGSRGGCWAWHAHQPLLRYVWVRCNAACPTYRPQSGCTVLPTPSIPRGLIHWGLNRCLRASTAHTRHAMHKRHGLGPHAPNRSTMCMPHGKTRAETFERMHTHAASHKHQRCSLVVTMGRLASGRRFGGWTGGVACLSGWCAAAAATATAFWIV